MKSSDEYPHIDSPRTNGYASTSGRMHERRPGSKPGQRPGSKPGQQPGSKPGQQPGLPAARKHGIDPEHDRPRERLRKHGCVAASDVDLLAVVIGSGSRDTRGPVSAVDLGHGLLRRHKSLRAIATLEIDELMGISGLGPAKSTAIVASFEMGRRVAAESVLPQEPIRGPKDVFKRFAPFMRDLPREVFNVVLLNTGARVIRTFTASEGGLAASIVEPRIVFRRAILANAASIICLHNHPSGNSEPSKEDIQITSQLSEAGRVLGIPLQDHLIIAGDGFTSLAERGLI